MSYLTDYKKAEQTNGKCHEYTPEQISAINAGADIATLTPRPVNRATLNSRRDTLALAMHILYKCIHTADDLHTLDIYKLAIDAEQSGIITPSEADILIIKSALVAENHNQKQRRQNNA